jgi:peroxiredoxin
MILSSSAELPLYIDTITTLYNDLNKSIQNSVSGRHFQLMLLNLNKSKVGSLAPAFTVNDINNNPISLSSYLHKDCVLLDFWASWCVPCREDIPSLKLIYKKYSNEGLKIICVSKDDDATLWEKAIGKDKIQNWKHILAPFSDQKNDSLITNKYFVYSIPVKILINKDGIIIGRWSGSGDENMEALKKLLNKDLGN